MKAYFIDGEKIGTEEVLLRIAEEAGISRDRAKEVLDSDEFAEDVRMDIAEAEQIGVTRCSVFRD